jgi:NADPH:quinone reductase-like Zn-dependent oxidoreductase
MTTTPVPTSPLPTGQHTMRAVVHHAYGSADVLHVAQVPRPEPGAKEVLVRVRGAGVDRAAGHLRTGRPYRGRLALGLPTPRRPVLGIEVAGVVAATGASVTRFAVGDEVYGSARGSFADYTVAAESRLAAKPASLSFEQAAALPVSAGTALQALTDVGRVQEGQRVLVIGASGGVGGFAVQIAKALGAEVTGVASSAKLDLVRALGADHVLDYRCDDFADGRTRYDLVLDIAGNPRLSRLRRAATVTGTVVITGGEEGGSFSGGMNRQLRAVALSPFVRQRLTMFIARQRSADLERLTGLVEAGSVTPSVDRVYPLDEVRDAVRRLEAGQVRGKVVLSA